MSKALLRDVFNQVLMGLSPQQLINNSVSVSSDEHGAGVLRVADMAYHLAEYQGIHLCASGKAAAPMASTLLGMLAAPPISCLVIGPYADSGGLPKGSYMQAAHPIADASSLLAGRAMLDAVSNVGADDLLIMCLSGGSSALVELPVAGVSLRNVQDTNRLMLHGGMPIEAINTVRKHLSQVKAGHLAQACRGQCLVIVMSDVLDNNLQTIASAPFYYDDTRFCDAISLLQQHQIWQQIPLPVSEYLTAGASGLHPETAKQASAHVHHQIIASNQHVLEQAIAVLAGRGITAQRANLDLSGDVSLMAQDLYRCIQQHLAESRDQTVPQGLIFGGETTVCMPKQCTGIGGRNQHLALLLSPLIADLNSHIEVTILSVATDGIDGSSGAAGAVIDGESARLARAQGVDASLYLANFDSNTYFAQTGELLITGPTHNNLLDLVLVLFHR